MTETNPHRTGMLLGTGAFLIWGLLPLYLKLLVAVPASQVLAHRIVWSLLLLAAIVIALRRVAGVRAAAQGRTLLLLLASASLIAVNWLIYIWAIQNAHVLEASLGYFINPLVNVALGVAVLGERIRPLQLAAVAVAVVGVVVMTVASVLAGGAVWWIPITLALSFAVYGLIRKMAAIDALGGLAVETLLLAPFALAWLVHAGAAGTAVFGQNLRLDLLLVFAGVATAAPLLLFNAAAKRLRYATIGLLQYIGPTIQFMLAMFVFGERVGAVHVVTFALIWAGCALYAFDSLRQLRAAAAA